MVIDPWIYYRIDNNVFIDPCLGCRGGRATLDKRDPATGTPQWGSAEVFFLLIVLLVCFLFSLLVLSVLLALSALPCLPIVCAKPNIKRKVELNSLDFSNSCVDALAWLMLAHVMSAVASDIEASERQRARALAVAMLQPARIIGKTTMSCSTTF